MGHCSFVMGQFNQNPGCRVLRSLPVLKSLKVWRLENISFGAWDVPLVFGKQSSLRRLQVRSQHSSYGALQSFLALSQINELIVHMTGYYDVSHNVLQSGSALHSWVKHR